MSLSKVKLWEPPNLNLRGREIMWMNTTYNAHNIFCGCNHPASHLLACMFTSLDSSHDEDLQQAIRIIQQKQQCHTTTTGTLAIEGGTHTEEGLDILDGVPHDIEELFAEDGAADEGEKDTG